MNKCEDCKKYYGQGFCVCPFCYSKHNNGSVSDYTIPEDELHEIEVFRKEVENQELELRKKSEEFGKKIKASIVLKNPEMYELEIKRPNSYSTNRYHFFTREEAEVKKNDSFWKEHASIKVVNTKDLDLRDIIEHGKDHGYESY